MSLPAQPMSALREVVRALTRLRTEARSAEEESAYRGYAHEVNLRSIATFFLSLAVLSLLWGATDAVVFARRPDVARLYGTYRPFLTGFSFVIYLVLNRLRPRAGLLEGIASVGGAAVLSVVAYGCGQGGGPSQPWIHFLALAPLSTALYTGSPRMRFGMLALLGTSMLAAYFGPHPDYWSDPLALATVSYAAFAHLVSFAVGVLVERSRRTSFFLRREIAGHAAQLGEVNDSLAGRVRQQTAELRALAAHLERAREEERTHIAREVHDELGQELTALRYQLALARQRHQKDPSSIGANLDELERLLQRTSATARELVRELRPRVLDDLGLAAAIEWLAGRTSERSGLTCQLSLPEGARQLPPAVATAAFRIVQEALTNTLRHAQATGVRIAVRLSEGALEVEVEDDGCGLPPSSARPPRGFGLIGMRERALALGGECVVEAASPRGTRVRAHLPLVLTPASVPESVPA